MTDAYINLIQRSLEIESFFNQMSSKELPQEILRDILERLPAKTLIIFRTVCKSWYSLITDHGFIASHLNRIKLHNKGCLLYVPLSKCDPQMCNVMCTRTLAEKFSLSFPFDYESLHLTIVGSCSGMLCLTDDDSNHFGRIVYLWNPSIRKFKTLPKSLHVTPQFSDTWTRVVLGLGFDHASGDHKIVRLSYFWDNKEKCFGQSEIEVYSLHTNSWRRIEATVSCRAQRSSVAFVNGSIHWIADRPKGPNRHLILSFDFSNEGFQEMMLPASCYTGIGIHSEVLAGFRGSLSLLINGTPNNSGMIHCCYMWVMKQYGVAESWVKQFKFVAREGIYRLPGLTTDGDIIYQNHKMEYYLCDPVDGRHKNTGLRGFRFHMVAFTESLVLLDEH